MRHMRDALFRAPAFRHIVKNSQQILHFSIVAPNRDALCRYNASSTTGGVDLIVTNYGRLLRPQRIVGFGDDKIGLLLRIYFIDGLSDDLRTGNTEKLFAGPIDQAVSALARVVR